MIRDVLFKLEESSIDFPRPEMTLSQEIWDRDTGGVFTLKSEVKDKIFEYIKSVPEVELMEKIVELHLIGSLATNLYVEDSDIDVHMILDTSVSRATQEEIKKTVKSWVKDHQVYIGTHPLELYVQMIPAQEYVADSLYDILQDTWLKGPKFEEDIYNPYQTYKDVFDKVSDLAKEADIDLGSLKRDVIDHEVITKAMGQLPQEAKVKLKSLLDTKLQEIEDDIDNLLQHKKEWGELRKGASHPSSKEQALKDVKMAKRWKESNAIFKFLDRYSYIKTITELEDLIKVGITNQDIPKVKEIIGAESN